VFPKQPDAAPAWELKRTADNSTISSTAVHQQHFLNSISLTALFPISPTAFPISYFLNSISSTTLFLQQHFLNTISSTALKSLTLHLPGSSSAQLTAQSSQAVQHSSVMR
jgi:hypothetical protein